MILDKVSNWKLYFKSPKFDEIFEELSIIIESTKDGVYTFEDYEFRVMSYKTKLKSEIIESHRKFVDIQILLKGSERIKVYDSSQVEISESYKDQTDCVFYQKPKNCHSDIVIQEGWMGVFFPDDIHNPQLAENQPIEIKKVVIKVNEKFFTS